MRPSLWLLCALLLWPSVGRPEDSPPEPPLPRMLRFEYILGPFTKTCDDPEMLKNAVGISAYRDPFDMSEKATLEVRFSRRGRRYEANIEVRDRAGSVVWTQRTIPLARCESLIQDLGFIIGDRLRDPLPPPPLPAPPKVEPLLLPPAPPMIEPLPPPPERLRLGFGLGGALAVRTTPPVAAFHLTADAGLRWKAFSFDGELRWAPPVSADANGGAQVTASQLTFGVVPCWHSRAFFGCGVTQLTAVVGAGSPGTLPVSDTGLTAAMGPRLGGDVPLWGSRVALRVSIDLLATLHHVAIHVDKRPASWTTPGLSMALGAGVVTDFELGAERSAKIK